MYAYHMQNIYWLMFIYFCLHVMDEMIELFSTINQMEKGALGLFFEMNHIIGLSLTIYIGLFVFRGNKLENSTILTQGANRDMFNKMYNFILFQNIYSFISLVFAFVVTFLYKSMNEKATKKEQGTAKVQDDFDKK